MGLTHNETRSNFDIHTHTTNNNTCFYSENSCTNFQWLKAKRLAKMYKQMQTRITLCNQVTLNMVGKQSFYKMKGIIHLLA